MDESSLQQFDLIEKGMRDIVYAIKPPDHMLFDLDSTLLDTFGTQEGEAFNYHYQAHGYHPCYALTALSETCSRWNYGMEPIIIKRRIQKAAGKR